MGKPIVEILDAVHCRADKEARRLIAPILKYQDITRVPTYIKTKSGKTIQIKKEKVVERTLMTGRKGSKGLFLTGLLPKIHKRLKKKIDIKGSEETFPPQALPKLPGITFRSDQRRALNAVRKRSRGVIVFPTGSGKTIIAGGIFSAFPRGRRLFLCHTKDLIKQTRDEFIKWFGKKNVLACGGGFKTNMDQITRRDNPILIATIQSYRKLDQKKLSIYWDLIIVDEEHHVNTLDSMYGKILSQSQCPRRYGLTATLPSKKVQRLINEGLFGPKIAELTVQEGVELGIIAKPKINLIPVPYDIKLNTKCNTFKEYYENCIVKNRIRNRLICRSIKKKEITLIIVERKEHGKQLQKMLKLKGQKVPFIFGDTKTDKRNKYKQKLKTGKCKLVISSRVWKEGINIPALNHIINAVGYKDEKAVLQAAGRGLRTAKGKTVIRVTDFLDPYRYLAEHSIMRIAVYVNKGWL